MRSLLKLIKLVYTLFLKCDTYFPENFFFIMFVFIPIQKTDGEMYGDGIWNFQEQGICFVCLICHRELHLICLFYTHSTDKVRSGDYLSNNNMHQQQELPHIGTYFLCSLYRELLIQSIYVCVYIYLENR